MNNEKNDTIEQISPTTPRQGFFSQVKAWIWDFIDTISNFTPPTVLEFLDNCKKAVLTLFFAVIIMYFMDVVIEWAINLINNRVMIYII